MAAHAGPAVEVQVLGPLRLRVAGAPVEVRGPKRRALLALLALARGRVVTVDHLLGALWPGEVPESGRAALHSHVSRLRTHLGPASGRLTTLEGGYRLVLDDGAVDAARARGLLTAARSAAGRDPVEACALLREALGLWRGPVLAEFGDVAPLAADAVALEQLRHELTDALVGCAVDAGQAGSVLDLATAAAAADPLREAAVLLRMRVLAATGRAAEALRAAHEFRRLLAGETGLDPSPALGELEREIATGAAAPTGRAAAPARPTTPLHGRAAQVAALRRLLASERLVTVTGPGGVGKTRLALEVARREGPVAVLPLAPVTDPAAVPHALAGALELQVRHGDVLGACIALLGAGPGLLVVDNCEHLLDAVRDVVGALVAGCPELTVLATSREPLGLPAECASRLAPLPLPAPREPHPERVASVAVFLDRAARVRPGSVPDAADLRRIGEIVRRLDGMPLAIELAAGRLSGFSPAELHDRLDRALDLLAGGRPSADARHRTLRATVEWSYDLLEPAEQSLFRHLAVFADGVDLATVEDVAAELDLPGDPGALLARLVDASMIDAVPGGRPAGRTRYRMLETLRAFGLDRLAAAGEDAAAEARLLRWAVGLARWIDAAVLDEREPAADAALRREPANLRAAWRLARRRGRTDDAVALVVALSHPVSWRDLTELRSWPLELADDATLLGHPGAAAVHGAASVAAYFRGEYRRADRLARTGLDLAGDAGATARCRTALSLAALSRTAFAEVIEHALAAAALAPVQREDLGVAALAAAYAGDLERARELNGRMCAAVTAPTLVAFGAYVAGEITSAAGDLDAAERHYGRAIALARESGATFVVGIASVGQLSVLTRAGRLRDALRGYRDLLDYWSRTGNWTHTWVTLRNLAELLRRLGDEEPAALLDAAADRAPDAPPAGDGGPPAAPDLPVPSRAGAVAVAREAVDRHLAARP